MSKTILLLTFLLISLTGFSQVKFMAGLSGSPNAAVGTYTNQDGVTFGKYAQGFSVGGGVDAGVYFGKRFFLLTGLERMGRQYSFHEGGNANPKTTETDHSWEIPLLANIIISHKEDGIVTCFISAGFIGGKTTVQNFSGDGFTGKFTGSDITDPYFVDASFGIGAKIKLHERLSLLLLPDIRYQISHPEYNTVYTASFRTMLFYNF